MLGKLFKYEMKSYNFTMGVTFLIAIAFTVCTKIMCMLPYQREIKEVIQMFCFIFFYYLIVMIAGVAQIVIVLNFYKTTVGDRGYLTWTLPVKTSAVLWSKSLAGGIWYLLSLIVMALCYGIFIIGDYWMGELNIYKEMLTSFSEMFEIMHDEMGIGHVVMMLVWTVILSVVGSLFSFMLLYMCIAIGQLFGKWRILASIGVYILIMFGIQVLYIIFVFVLSFGVVAIDDMVINMNPGVLLNSILGIVSLLALIGYAGTFAITNNIFKKRLNLE